MLKRFKKIDVYVWKIILVSSLIVMFGFILYLLFQKMNPTIALAGLLLMFIGIIVFFYLPEYIMWRKTTEEKQ
ncbi:MAG: hypothetical protein QW702_09165 [Candidatus Bathyarchaeia archaeon]